MKNRKNKFKLKIALSLALVSISLTTGCTDKQLYNFNKFFDSANSSFNIDKNSSNNDNNTDNNIASNNEDIQKLIENITISDANYNNEYNRDDYTSSYQKYEYNGEKFTSIRNYSYYASIWYDDSNEIYTDPYNGEEYNNPKSLDFDHIVPLAYVNSHGGYEWTNEEKRAFADNPKIGIDVNAHDNRSKSDKGPSEWLPEENKDDYCYTWLLICSEYNISMTQDDMDTCLDIIENHTEDGLINLCQYK